MSEERVLYETDVATRYRTYQETYQTFLMKTGIDPAVIESWEVSGRKGDIKIWLKDGGIIIFTNKES